MSIAAIVLLQESGMAEVGALGHIDLMTGAAGFGANCFFAFMLFSAASAAAGRGTSCNGKTP
jgi:hypothetical protein